MDAQKFCLTWKDFNMIFNKEFEELRKSEDFFDVTLACEENQVNAHKLVLSAASDFFKNILKKNKHDHPLIYLTGVKFSDLQAILDFIYTGETEVSEGDLENLLSTASKLKVKGLTESQANLESEASTMQTLMDGTSKKKKEIVSEERKSAQQSNDDPDFGIRETELLEIKSEQVENEPNYLKVSPADKLIRRSDPMDISSFLSPEEQQQLTSYPIAPSYPQPPAVVNEPTQGQDYISNKNELERQCSELMVSSYDSVVGKTVWQCAQCHYSSKLRYTVKEHVETHISGFSHQCPLCDKSCNTRNALRVHNIRKHLNKPQVEKQQPLM
eukprot:GFUD01029204.1.p1 GENE.GFUD01029204.1~~GFUD01029204.1.p1  ORF type:complete len:328 (-),score=83.44 GFUD01029204.1:750-1733(-)